MKKTLINFMKLNFHKKHYIPYRFVIGPLLFMFGCTGSESYIIGRTFAHYHYGDNEEKELISEHAPRYYSFTFRLLTLWSVLCLLDKKPFTTTSALISLPVVSVMMTVNIIKHFIG